MIQEPIRRAASLLTVATLLMTGPGSVWGSGKDRGRDQDQNGDSAAEVPTTTPIKHVVVIFQENVSFDHYFATYPYAANPVGETPFQAKENTPRVNNLLSGGLLTSNPNSTQPFRMDPTMSVTCDQNHS
jgi:phospholipase C